ncbi:hypothetical protein C9994_10595, partial [Marivirga lumbricoides]
RFEKQTKTPLTLDTISQRSLNKLQDYFYSVAKLNTQTTAKYIGVLKMFLNWASREGYTTQVAFRDFHPIQQKNSIKVALSYEELDQIRQAEIPNDKKRLENVRSLFLLSCFTGLRYSDYIRIKEEHIKKDEAGDLYIQIEQEKTGDFVDLPLTDEALAIVNSLIDGSVKPISNQKMNTYVKELCELAEINEPFAVRTYRGKNYHETKKPKYELVSTHTGRRTFATNLLMRNIPAETVMQFTGHRDYKSFSKYVNIPKKAKMQSIKDALMIGRPEMKIAK